MLGHTYSQIFVRLRPSRQRRAWHDAHQSHVTARDGALVTRNHPLPLMHVCHFPQPWQYSLPCGFVPA
jgi:hypothetical protein